MEDSSDRWHELVGVLSGVSSLRRLKQYALLCDSLVIPSAVNAPSRGLSIAERLDLAWLIEQGVVSDAGMGAARVAGWPETHPDVPKAIIDQSRMCRALRLISYRAKPYLERGDRADEQELAIAEAIHVAAARMTSAVLKHRGVAAVPLLGEHDLSTGRSRPSDVSQDVWDVVVENLPAPSGGTAWEQILDFRSDERVRAFHRALRGWILAASSSAIPARVAAGEIESAITRYNLYMSEYRIGRAMGTLQAVMKGAAVGAVAGIGVSEAAAIVGMVGSVVVTLRRRQAELRQVEVSAPGAELAYIVKAREQFGR